jgi:hypothetical protein
MHADPTDDIEVNECTFYDTQFEGGVADPGPHGEPRCRHA